jgi:CobQ-like glutamine amidotransferase family enzyme
MAGVTGTVTIVNVFPGLLGTYGDVGNAIALTHRLRERDLPVEVLDVEPGDPIPTVADIYLLGGGEDRSQALATGLIGDALTRAVDHGATVFGVCAGFQILGRSFTDATGATYPGLGLVDVVTEPLAQRAVGEMVADCTLPGVGQLVGFENHRGGTLLGIGVAPLGLVTSGIGNALSQHTDGASSGRVLGTYLHGPVLALNPALADHILAGVMGALPPIDDDRALRARALRLSPRRA